jgi:hypothetical protein
VEFRLGTEQPIYGPGDVTVIPGGTEHVADIAKRCTTTLGAPSAKGRSTAFVRPQSIPLRPLFPLALPRQTTQPR